MKSKKGFISMSLVYSFLIVFLFLMVSIISCYSQKISYLDAINNQISQDLETTISTKLTLFKTIIKDNEIDNISHITTYKDGTEVMSLGNGVYAINDVNIIDENNDNYSEEMYIYRGNVDNNYVVFGYQFNREDDSINKTTIKQMCWKILRTNEDKSIRLVYYGIYDDNKCNLNTLKSTQYNYLSDDNAYVGYTYGNINASTYENAHQDGVNESSIKLALDSWISTNTNLVTTAYSLSYEDSSLKVYDNLIKDEIFCNNRTLNSTNNILTNGFGKINTLYASNGKTKASYKCENLSNVKNIYTLGSEYGGTINYSGKLRYKVGLLTYDDVILAGGSITKERNYFLNYGINYWTMTPSKYENGAYVYYVNSNGKIVDAKVDNEYRLVPVINIDQNAIVNSGNGTNNSPYIISEVGI